MSKRPLNTLFTDASYDPDLKVAGWGAWLAGSPGEFVGGKIRQSLDTANEAELAAILNALGHFASDNQESVFMIQSDSVLALQTLISLDQNIHQSKGPSDVELTIMKKISPQLRKIHKAINRIQMENKIAILVRHVRGHQNVGKSGRFWVNDRCDAIAKNNLNKLRRELCES